MAWRTDRKGLDKTEEPRGVWCAARRRQCSRGGRRQRDWLWKRRQRAVQVGVDREKWGAPGGRPRPSLDLLRTGHGQNSASRKQLRREVCVCKTQTVTVDQAHSGPWNCVLGLFPGQGTGPSGVDSGTAIRPWPEPSSPVSISVHSEADRSQGARGWGSLDPCWDAPSPALNPGAVWRGPTHRI